VKETVFHKYETVGSGDTYYTTSEPVFKEIDGIKYIEATPDFHRVAFIRFDMLRYMGNETKRLS
jgi:hypothetical protein